MRGLEILRFGLQRVFEAHLDLLSVYSFHLPRRRLQ